MQFEIVTIFPEFFAGPLDYGIVRRAREARLVDVRVHDLRAFTHDRHRTVDDRPFGGGEGMVLKPEPLFEAVESLAGGAGENVVTRPYTAKHRCRAGSAIVLLSAPENYFARTRRAGLRNSIGSSCSAAATKEWTSAWPNISPRTNSRSAISCFPAANWAPRSSWTPSRA